VLEALNINTNIGIVSLFNMSGNVWEWCMTDDSSTDSVDSSANKLKVTALTFLKRGGAYNDSATQSSNDHGRVKNNPRDSDEDTGFRLVQTASGSLVGD
jgi:formylglycine-generating enzyme required for sulfatase activity